MELSYTQAIGLKIVNKKNKLIGEINDLLINKNSGKILGILTNKKIIIAEENIIKWEKNILVEELNEKDTCNKNKLASKVIINKEVKTIDKVNLGKVNDFFFNTRFMDLKSISAVKQLFNQLTFDRRIIPANQIIEIKRDYVLVQSSNLLEKFKIENIFQQKQKLNTEISYCKSKRS